MTRLEELQKELQDCLQQLVANNEALVEVDHEARQRTTEVSRLKGQIERLNNHAKELTTAISKEAFNSRWQQLFGPKSPA